VIGAAGRSVIAQSNFYCILYLVKINYLLTTFYISAPTFQHIPRSEEMTQRKQHSVWKRKAPYFNSRSYVL